MPPNRAMQRIATACRVYISHDYTLHPHLSLAAGSDTLIYVSLDAVARGATISQSEIGSSFVSFG